MNRRSIIFFSLACLNCLFGIASNSAGGFFLRLSTVQRPKVVVYSLGLHRPKIKNCCCSFRTIEDFAPGSKSSCDKYNGTIQGLKYIWRTEGFRGLFKGNGTNCARIVPNFAVKFFTYEEASKGILYLYRQQPGNEDDELTPLLRLGAGACAGIIAMSATYPMFVVALLSRYHSRFLDD